jgi:phage baseplate assembly protein W
MATVDQVLGRGLIRPFRRDQKTDFAATGGAALVKAAVGQILGTMCSDPNRPEMQGEMPWRTEFGSLLYLLRHRKNDDALAALARSHVGTALARWEPRVRVTNVEVTREQATSGSGENVLRIWITYDILAQPRRGNAVVARAVTSEVFLAAA